MYLIIRCYWLSVKRPIHFSPFTPSAWASRSGLKAQYCKKNEGKIAKFTLQMFSIYKVAMAKVLWKVSAKTPLEIGLTHN